MNQYVLEGLVYNFGSPTKLVGDPKLCSSEPKF